jgi:predicted phage baseplate assembly protein
MPLVAPNLDDRRFEDILAEAKSLIPRYAPQWTDYNESDPGITLLELFSWLTELTIYRLNRVPERNYIKFLELLGITPKPAEPARVELTFTPSRHDVPLVIVPPGTEVATAAHGPEKPLVFETDEALLVLGATLAAIQSFDGFSYFVETTKNNAAGQWFYPFGPHARPDAALLLGFDSPVSLPADQFHLAVHVATEGLTPEGHHCDLDLAAMPLAADIRWEYWNGQAWRPLSLDKDETRAFTRSGHIYFRGPGASAVKAKLGGVPAMLYWLRARLASSGYDMAPRVASALINTVRATQAQTVHDEVLGGSDGRPNQSYQLSSAPVLTLDKPVMVAGADGKRVTVTSLRLEIDEGSGFQVWQQVDDFDASGPYDPHYTLDRTTGQIQFGAARIPVANPANPSANIIARLYRYGGGAAGNAGADTITQIQNFVAGIDGVTHALPAAGGSDEESVDDAKRRAPLVLKSRDRAVTAEDFEYLAQQTPGVRIRRAKALPLVHPKYRGMQVPGVVSVIVVPESDAPNPLPGEATLRLVCAHLNVHRLLTTELYVIPPVYRKVKIVAEVAVRLDADLSEVKTSVLSNLVGYFHPLTGGEDGAGWPFGGPIFYSDVMARVLGTAGVARVLNSNLTIWLDDVAQPVCQDVPLCDGELLYSDQHDIRVSYVTK